MQPKYNPVYFILAIVVALVLTPLMVGADPPAQIAFSSERDGNYEIYVMDADGRNQRRLTNNRLHDRYPSWSPDGTRIAFTSGKDKDVDLVPGDIAGKRPQIYVMEANGKNRQKLSNNDFAAQPSWSPGGTRIAFTGRATVDAPDHIYVMDADGKNPRNLTKQNPINQLLVDWEPSWSPDGERIAFAASRDAFGWCIYMMDADGSNQQRLSDNSGWDSSPSWSPDGERIAFVSMREGNKDIYVMDADGENLRRRTRNPAPDLHPSWSPDGERIAFVSHRDGNYEIYTMNADGARQVRRLTKGGSEDTDPTWFDPSFTVEVVPFAVGPAGKNFTMWGWLKQVAR